MKNTRSFVVTGIGEVLWDLLPGGKQLGGAPANFAYHVHALGAKGTLVSRVGDDDLGREIQRRIEALGINSAYLTVDPQRPTGTVEVTLDEKGHPEYVIQEAVAWDVIPFSEELEDLASRCNAVCFGTLCSRSETSRRTVRRFLEATPDHCLKVYDINLRQSYYSKTLVQELLAHATVLKLNEDELPIVCDYAGIDRERPEQERLKALASTCDLQVIALTCGSKGSILYAADELSLHSGVKAETADTVGAGDSFTAALILGLLNRHDLDDINRHANSVAAFVCSQHGATPNLPARLTGNTVKT